MSKYYVFGGRSWASNPARLIEPASINRGGVWWDDGERFEKSPCEPITVSLKPFDSDNPDMSEEMPELFFRAKVPLYREDLIEALSQCGGINMDIYDAQVLDPDTGNINTQYKAVNLLGLYSVADLNKSNATVHEGGPEIDVSFDSLVLDESKASKIPLKMFRMVENNSTILVHESVKEYLLAEGFKLEFYELDQVAI